MTLTTVSNNCSVGCVCCRQCELSNVRAQWSGIHSRKKLDGIRVWPSRWKRSRGSTNVPSHVPWQAAALLSHMMWRVHACMHPMEATSNICCDMDGIQAMYCVSALFVWCSAVPYTVETMHFRTQGNVNIYAPPEVCRWTWNSSVYVCIFSYPSSRFTSLMEFK